MSRPVWRQPVRIAEAVESTFQRLGLESRFRESEIWRVWPMVVGPQIARHAQPHALSYGRLVVHVTDPVWLHHLSMMRHRIVAALNKSLKASSVREIVLRVGAVTAPTETGRGAVPNDDAAAPDPAHVDRVEALLKPLGETPFRDGLFRLLLKAYRPGERGPSR